MSLNEAQTRIRLIDSELRRASCRLDERSQVLFDGPVDGYYAEPWIGVTAYCRYETTGNLLAVVEAKRTSRSSRGGEEQLRHYLTEIAKRQKFTPIGFLSSAFETYYWELGVGNPRMVGAYCSPADLSRLLFIRQNGKTLETVAINTSIVERPYQNEAIRRVAEAFAIEP